MTTSEIVHHQGGTTFAGPDAVNLVRAAYLKSALSLYAKTGMLMTRGAKPTLLLKMAEEYTGKKYKGKDKYNEAAEGVRVWIETMKAALPTTVVHRDGTQEQL
jgi:hypothetical protein